MADREKVIKGFELCLETIDSPDCPDNCPYLSICKKYENRVILQPLMRDALELLKEQEPVKDKNVPNKLIRCKDCKHGEECEKPYNDYWCHLHDIYQRGDWFCADGERRESE